MTKVGIVTDIFGLVQGVIITGVSSLAQVGSVTASSHSEVNIVTDASGLSKIGMKYTDVAIHIASLP